MSSAQPLLSAIVAMTRSGVIGQNNALPWRLPKDLQYFKECTMGAPIIMGRKTFDSLKRPLPGRKNIVISRNPTAVLAPAIGVSSLEAAIVEAKKAQVAEIFVIGGGQIFSESLPLLDRLYITWIEHPYPGDIHFPDLKLLKFEEISRFGRRVPEPHHYSTYERRPKPNLAKITS